MGYGVDYTKLNQPAAEDGSDFEFDPVSWANPVPMIEGIAQLGVGNALDTARVLTGQPGGALGPSLFDEPIIPRDWPSGQRMMGDMAAYAADDPGDFTKQMLLGPSGMYSFLPGAGQLGKAGSAAKLGSVAKAARTGGKHYVAPNPASAAPGTEVLRAGTGRKTYVDPSGKRLFDARVTPKSFKDKVQESYQPRGTPFTPKPASPPPPGTGTVIRPNLKLTRPGERPPIMSIPNQQARAAMENARLFKEKWFKDPKPAPTGPDPMSHLKGQASSGDLPPPPLPKQPPPEPFIHPQQPPAHLTPQYQTHKVMMNMMDKIYGKGSGTPPPMTNVPKSPVQGPPPPKK